MKKTEEAPVIGRNGGLARAAKLTPKQRQEIARKAALARWKGHQKSTGKSA